VTSDGARRPDLPIGIFGMSAAVPPFQETGYGLSVARGPMAALVAGTPDVALGGTLDYSQRFASSASIVVLPNRLDFGAGGHPARQ
jgi:hypothetical protein